MEERLMHLISEGDILAFAELYKHLTRNNENEKIKRIYGKFKRRLKPNIEKLIQVSELLKADKGIDFENYTKDNTRFVMFCFEQGKILCILTESYEVVYPYKEEYGYDLNLLLDRKKTKQESIGYIVSRINNTYNWNPSPYELKEQNNRLSLRYIPFGGHLYAFFSSATLETSVREFRPTEEFHLGNLLANERIEKISSHVMDLKGYVYTKREIYFTKIKSPAGYSAFGFLTKIGEHLFECVPRRFSIRLDDDSSPVNLLMFLLT